MPLPKPRSSGETNEQWMARCMGDETAKNEMKHDQHVAFCINSWRQHHGPAATGPKPKAAMANCMPMQDETSADFMDRCMATGASHEACMLAWEAESAMGDKSVQMKWMPSLLEVKGLNDGQRMIRGIATTPSVDHVGDIVESMGAKYNLPIPLLWAHKHDQPVGHVTFVEPTDKGIPFEAHIAKIDEPGKLKDRVDEAWQSVKAGLVKGVSIGFTPVRGETEMLKGGGYRFKTWNWHELSLVVVPAQVDAQIQLIRALDAQALKAAMNQEPANASPRVAAPQKEPPMGRITEEESCKLWLLRANDPLYPTERIREAASAAKDHQHIIISAYILRSTDENCSTWKREDLRHVAAGVLRAPQRLPLDSTVGWVLADLKARFDESERAAQRALLSSLGFQR